MKSFLLLLTTLYLLASCQQQTETQEEGANLSTPPNIIYILADDLGYRDIGVYGQEKIETPNIDALAADGMRFIQHYAGAPVCAPSRCVLITGKHSGHAYIRGNDEWGDRGDVWNYMAMYQDSTLEGQRPLPADTQTIPKLLREAGYSTGMIGKWGLGSPDSESIPTSMGFDYFFGYNCQRQAHTYYPLHLYENETRVFLSNDTVPPRTGLPEGANPFDLASYAPFTLAEYTPTLMFENMQRFIAEQQDQPFFFYWASPIPHMPLQAPQRWVDYYVDKFGEEEPYLGDKGYFPHRYPHAAYAAMVSYLDENIGKLVAQLKAAGIYENTLIIFSSDNGPTYNGGTDTPWFDSAKPFQSKQGRIKGSVYEGGIRVPMIATWPAKIEAGASSDHISAFYDVLPTLREIAGIDMQVHTDGISFLPTLVGEDQQQQKHEFLYWEFPGYRGQLAIRMGKWKFIQRDLNSDSPTLELYNLNEDPGESENVAEEHPEVIQQAVEIFEREHSQPTLDKFKMQAIETGLIGSRTAGSIE